MLRVAPLFLLLLFAGCSSDDPTQPSYSVDHLDFSDPDSTLGVLMRAVHDRSITEYGLCFADTLVEGRDFHASFDSVDSAQFMVNQGLPIPPWRRSEELDFFPEFVALYPDDLYETEITIDDDRGGIVVIGGPTATLVYNVRYHVRAGTTPVAAGAAALRFERLGLAKEYKITYWEDRRDIVTAITWGKRRLDSL